jgi:hypothetical protein
MNRSVRFAGATILCLLLACLSTEPGAAERATVEDGTNPTGGGGVPRGRWYSTGTVVEQRWFQTYEQRIVFFPPPPHYEVRMVTVLREVYYLLEACYADTRINECSPGAQRKTYQGG